MSKESGTRVWEEGTLLSHLLALCTVCIWGLTFVSTKVLIGMGLSPTEIFVYRFLIAYLCILTISHKRLLAGSARDEALLFLAGLSGGSLYFITENHALRLTPASDVSLLICTSPVFTILLGYIFLNGEFRFRMVTGTLLALCGVGFVVFNGTVNLGI
ncbi:MAG: DMT family transporter, partial [Bacteroidaceae bacterium]|nr:DMT family transporter [Bacteroidaceae bacterium]